MRKEERNNGRTGKDRWLVSYADFITLLFAFFVVMYSISSINNEKYRVFSYALGEAFPETFKKFGTISTTELAEFVSVLDGKKNAAFEEVVATSDASGKEGGNFQDTNLKLKIKTQFKVLITDKKIRIKDSVDWLEIEVGSNILFNSGSSFLNNDAECIIKELAEILMTTDNTITIEGFTDDIPIYNTIYPSNWELSADRASAVARAFIVAGFKPERLAVTGYGDNFPIADNQTAEGRQQNRRIVIVVEKENKRKKYLAVPKD